jgi:polyphosphate kinase
MDRNFFRRVELACPILDKALKRRVIREGLRLHLTDNATSWQMRADGVYTVRRRTGANRKAVQDTLLQMAL